MELGNYYNSCRSFRKATKDWSKLSPHCFYSATENAESVFDGWSETFDKKNKGMDVSWCFWRKCPNGKFTPKTVAEHFVSNIARELVSDIDNGADIDDVRSKLIGLI